MVPILSLARGPDYGARRSARSGNAQIARVLRRAPGWLADHGACSAISSFSGRRGVLGIARLVRGRGVAAWRLVAIMSVLARARCAGGYRHRSGDEVRRVVRASGSGGLSVYPPFSAPGLSRSPGRPDDLDSLSAAATVCVAGRVPARARPSGRHRRALAQYLSGATCGPFSTLACDSGRTGDVRRLSTIEAAVFEATMGVSDLGVVSGCWCSCAAALRRDFRCRVAVAILPARRYASPPRWRWTCPGVALAQLLSAALSAFPSALDAACSLSKAGCLARSRYSPYLRRGGAAGTLIAGSWEALGPSSSFA